MVARKLIIDIGIRNLPFILRRRPESDKLLPTAFSKK